MWDALVAQRRHAREVLERARQALGVARIGRQGETDRGLQLLVLYEIAELALGDLAALSEALRWRSERSEPIPAQVIEALSGLARAQEAIAQTVVERKPPVPDLPHAADLPSFVTDQTVTPTPFNPMGAKGIGEAATIGSTPAIVNAVVDALKPFGVRHLDMPLRAERVWRAMQSGARA